MRHKKLLISSIIGIIGLVIYFVSIPSIDEDALVNLTVEAGDEERLEDIYFSGYIYDVGPFHLDYENGVNTNENLSYLESIDAPEDQSLKMLQDKYPEFVDELVYSSDTSDYYLLNSEKHLFSSYFKINKESYYVDDSTLYLNALNKETNERIEDEVKRKNYTPGDQVNIVGLYEEYPIVKILYNTSSWNGEIPEGKSNLSIGVYNFETKDYTETSLLNETGSFYEDISTSYSAMNNESILISHFDDENTYETDEMNLPIEPTFYVYNFVEDTLKPLEDSTKKFFIGDKNKLYTIGREGETTLLQQYNETGEEVVNEVTLDLQSPLNLQEQPPYLLTKIMDDQLFIIQSSIPESSVEGSLSSTIQILDIYSGENLLSGEVHYDTNSEAHATEAFIQSIGHVSEF